MASSAGPESPDPDPEQSTGLEPGGSVPPGETPPAEASTTRGVSYREASLPSRRTNKVVLGVIVTLALVVVVFFVAYSVLVSS